MTGPRQSTALAAVLVLDHVGDGESVVRAPHVAPRGRGFPFRDGHLSKLSLRGAGGRKNPRRRGWPVTEAGAR